MSKHTPGPWIADQLVDGYDIHAAETRFRVATASDPEMVWGAIGREEDARLIAAAPELLEALEKIVRMFEGADDTVWAVEDYHQKARAAIAKAKGEE